MLEDEENFGDTSIADAQIESTASTVQLEREWWEEKIDLCEEASRVGNIGEMHKILRELGGRDRKAMEGHNITKEEFKEYFQRVSQDRYEVELQEMERTLREVKDLRNTQRAIDTRAEMNETPQEDEIRKALMETKDSAPGKDCVKISYIREAPEEVKREACRMVSYMFENRAHKWEESLKIGQMVSLYKKGDRNDKNNYRGVCLLAMASRVLGRVMAGRLRWWSEHLGFTDDNQNGFRPGRSTADATQIMIRIEEEEQETDLVAVLLDLRKAYPWVNKSALWAKLERCRMEGNCLKTQQDLPTQSHQVCCEGERRGQHSVASREGSVKDATHPPASSIYTIKR